PFIIVGKRLSFARFTPVALVGAVTEPFEPSQPLIDVGNKTDLAHLAVADDIDAGLGLLTYAGIDRRLDACIDCQVVDRLAGLTLLKHLDQIGRTRQASHMRSKDPFLAG